jgi:hypothetical protein
MLAALSCGGGDGNRGATAAPMMSEADVSLALSQNYAFWQITLVVNDLAAFASNFADSATMYAPSYGRLVGRAAIVNTFDGEATRLGIAEIRRESQGKRIEGRDVLDSGSYEILTSRPLPPNAIDAKGRYWTRWRYTEGARWIILSDSLVGNPR